MDMGQIIDGAIRLYRLNFGEFLAIAAVTLPLNAAAQSSADLSTTRPAGDVLAAAVPTLIVALIAQRPSVADIDFKALHPIQLPTGASCRKGHAVPDCFMVAVIVVALAIAAYPSRSFHGPLGVLLAVIEGESSSGDGLERGTRGHYMNAGHSLRAGVAREPLAGAWRDISAAAPVAAAWYAVVGGLSFVYAAVHDVIVRDLPGRAPNAPLSPAARSLISTCRGIRDDDGCSSSVAKADEGE
jgi:hypothetical protein